MRLRRLRFFALSFALRREVFLRLDLRGPLLSIKNMGGLQGAATLLNQALVSKLSPHRRPRGRGSAPSCYLLRVFRSAAALVLTLLVSGCGANVSKTYESDVRFERCYSLDWGDVDPLLRKRCWEEWAEHHADGQPLDRVAFAKRQLGQGTTEGTAAAQLAVGSSQASASPSAVQLAPAPVLPQPTSVFAPVPMMAKPSGTASAKVEAVPVPRTACEERCDRSMEACLGGCGSPVCEGFCAQKHTRCASKCPSPLEPPTGSPSGPAQKGKSRR